jgi:hypothetical protein
MANWPRDRMVVHPRGKFNRGDEGARASNDESQTAERSFRRVKPEQNGAIDRG